MRFGYYVDINAGDSLELKLHANETDSCVCI